MGTTNLLQTSTGRFRGSYGYGTVGANYDLTGHQSVSLAGPLNGYQGLNDNDLVNRFIALKPADNLLFMQATSSQYQGLNGELTGTCTRTFAGSRARSRAPWRPAIRASGGSVAAADGYTPGRRASCRGRATDFDYAQDMQAAYATYPFAVGKKLSFNGEGQSERTHFAGNVHTTGTSFGRSYYSLSRSLQQLPSVVFACIMRARHAASSAQAPGVPLPSRAVRAGAVGGQPGGRCRNAAHRSICTARRRP